ncbi:hypothetical protein M0805_009793 [Coniferiporia weirii]|nr:hypothetical protein M0805_009793 [Coniferiporia weirii]
MSPATLGLTLRFECVSSRIILLRLLLGSLVVLVHSGSADSSMAPLSAPSEHSPRLHVSQTLLDVDNYPVAPPGLSLEQVHVYVRHGERTPVRVRMSDPPASIPAHWLECQTARRFSAAVETLGGTTWGPLQSENTDVSPVKVVERADGTAVDGECFLGELTDMGKQSTLNYGRALRKLYVEKLGFLPSTLRNNNEVYFRSTNMPRTIESLQQVMRGLYSYSELSPGIIPQLRVRESANEDLVANAYSCKRLEQLIIGFARAAAAEHNQNLEPLDEKLSRYIGGNPIRVDGQPRASGILDTIRASIVHGIEVPPEFKDESIVEPIEKAVVAEWFEDKTEEVRRLGMGRLLGALESKMSAATKNAPANKSRSGGTDLNNSSPRMLVHSTHDTALAALLATLDVFDDKWPAFTASITFELFSNANTPDTDDDASPSQQQTTFNVFSPSKSSPSSPPREHFVRARYQNRSLLLPFCAARGKHLAGRPEFCTLAAFAARVRALAPSPSEWERECALREQPAA